MYSQVLIYFSFLEDFVLYFKYLERKTCLEECCISVDIIIITIAFLVSYVTVVGYLVSHGTSPEFYPECTSVKMPYCQVSNVKSLHDTCS